MHINEKVGSNFAQLILLSYACPGLTLILYLCVLSFVAYKYMYVCMYTLCILNKALHLSRTPLSQVTKSYVKTEIGYVIMT